MKAFLLAAGKGTRLRPLTDHTPKCLIPIHGQPLLAIWMELFRQHGITDVLINTHYLPKAVETFIASRTPHTPRATLFHEPNLLGSAGTVAANHAFVAGEKDFLVVYADNLTNMDLSALIAFHQRKNSPFTVGLFHTRNPSECGIAQLDAEQRIVRFEEKPKHPAGDLANAGVYVASGSLFNMLPDKKPLDFGYDVLPLFTGNMYGYIINGFYTDIGTPERWRWAEDHWPDKEQGALTC